MEKKWKKKAISLTLITTVTVGAPSIFLGCNDPKIQETIGEDTEDTAYHGTGDTPFIFPKNSEIDEQNNNSNGGSSTHAIGYRSTGWLTWKNASTNNDDTKYNSTDKNSKSKGYSSFIRESSSS